jgi:hypothetical protein
VNVTRWQNPVGFWAYVAGVTLALAALWALVVLPLAGGSWVALGLAAGTTLILASVLYGPSTLDMTGWTIAVYAMMPAGAAVFLGTLVALVAWELVSPHVEVTIK